MVHTAPYDRVQGATGALLDRAAKNGIVWQATAGANTDVWTARVESYPTDPQQEPDPEKWVTQLAFLVATRRHRRSSHLATCAASRSSATR